MKNVLFLGLLIVTIQVFQSCENTIEIDLPTDQTNTESVFKDKRGATSALANLYINLRENSIFSGTSQAIGTSLGLYTDELELLSTSTSTDNFLLYNNSLDPTKYVISNLWNTSYSHIYAINSFISGVTNSNGITTEDKDIFIRQALLLRAMYYQALAQIFGDIPYTTSTDYKANTKIVKTAVLEVFKLIEQDLLKALETSSYNDGTINKYYPNKAVVELLLAKNYLLQKKYENAEIYAKQVIDNPLYNLEIDLTKTFKNDSRGTLWQMPNSDPTAGTYEANTYIPRSNSTGYKISKTLLNSFDDNDLRKELWTNDFQHTGRIYPYKYKNKLNNSDECSILFRIEEAYFILSEALIYQNQEKQAIPYLNKIRSKAGLFPLSNTLNKEQILQAMLKESQKEFFLEHGRRFFDLKRNNKLDILKSTKPNWQDKYALFPYPEKEILINPNLHPQNEY